jgi:hypothetical protein
MNFQYYVSKFEVSDSHELPIKKIDGVDVTVYIEKWKLSHNFVMKLAIYFGGLSSKVTNKYITNEDEFEKCFDELLHYKFDKMKNDFVDGREEQIPFEFYSRLISPNLTLTYQDCCVCLEKTSGKTKCNHTICESCLTKIKTNKCPLCRACIEGECDCDGTHSDDDDE